MPVRLLRAIATGDPAVIGHPTPVASDRGRGGPPARRPRHPSRPPWSVAGRLALGVLAAAACVLPACGPGGGADAPGLLPVELPELDGLHPSVRTQVEAAQAALAEVGRGSAAERGAAFGRLGLLLMAGEHPAAAEPSLRNAVQLLPREFRWTYYLAHLYRQQGDLAQAAEYFERAHDRRPDDFPALIWLVGTLLNLGQPEAVEPWLAKARALRPGSAVVRFQEGRTAAATRDHARAVEHLNAVLRLDPNASVAHYPLAMAYRALGDLEAAEYHLGRAGGGDGGGSLGLSDPLMADLATLLRSPQAHRARALEADANGDRPEAARQFQMAVELDPADPLMRLSLAMAQDRAGNPRGALPELEAALELDPELAQAHYVLGTLLERSGRDEEAIDRFTAAAARDPLSAEVQLRLADALRRTGRVEASLAGYRRTLEIDAGAEGARFGEGMALVRLGRHREARERLESALGRTAGHPLFATALARLLAASPDARVRDGRRAFELVEVVVAEHKTTDVAETMAMALAELGEFRGAMEWQQLAIDVATDAGRSDLAARMSDNLARYRRGEPCRTPWRDDAPEHRPGPAVEPGLLGAGPTS